MPRIKSAKKDKAEVVITGRNSACTMCGLHKTSSSGDKHVVCLWGTGTVPCDIMLVGEAPGAEEIVNQAPFVGEAGKLLNKYLTLVGIDRSKLYISNAVKCRPEGNRTPKPMEIKACTPYLDYEISQVKPKIIGLLGAVALKRVLGLDGITKLRGKPIWSEKYKCWCVATWHPSYIRRNGETIEDTEQFRRDLSYIKKIGETGDTGQLKTEYTVVDTIDKFKDLMSTLSTAKYSSVDTETHGDFLNGKILAISFSWSIGKAAVVPFFKTGKEYTEPTDPFWSKEETETIWREIKTYLEDESKKKIGQNIKYDYQFFRLYGIELSGVIFDTMLGHYLLDENAKGQHDLGTLALKFTDMGDYSHELYSIMGIKSSEMDSTKMITAPFRSLMAYACKDSDATFRIFCVLYTKLKNQNLLFLLQKMMIPLSFILGEMEMSGVLVDVDYYIELAKQYESQVVELEKQLRSFPDILILEKQQDKPVNFNSPVQMEVLFYDILRLPVYKMTGSKNKKKKSKDKARRSTDKEVLEKLAELHDLPKLLLKHRKLCKFLSTYVKPIPELVKSDGRLHTSYQQHTTTTGRLSSSNPNLQNIPKREPHLAKEIRHGIIAPEGYKLIEADQGQIEFRLLINESKDPQGLTDLKSGLDIHKTVASASFGIKYEDVTPEIREKAKTIVYSVVYGKSEENLAKETGLTVLQVKAVFAALFRRYPKFQEYMARLAKMAESTGEVTNWVGRKRHLLEAYKRARAITNPYVRESLIAEARRQAINSPIQGGAHDILTVCSIRMHAELKKRKLPARLIMNIHDALIVESKDEYVKEVATLLKEKMEETIPSIQVPLSVDVAVGQRLSETKKLPKEWFTQ